MWRQQGLLLWEAPGQAADQRETPEGQKTGLRAHTSSPSTVGPVGRGGGGVERALDELFVIWVFKCITGDSP